MSYRDELNTSTTTNESSKREQAQERGISITEDVKQIFNDDTLFGELMTQTVGAVVGNLTEKAVEKLHEAVNQTLQSDEFSGRLGDQLGWKDIERQPINTEVKNSPEIDR